MTIPKSEPMTAAPTVDALEAVAALGRAVGAHSITRAVRELVVRLDRSRLFVRVMAATAALRADLMNALLGEAVMPAAAIPVVIRFGAVCCARVHFHDGAVRELDSMQGLDARNVAAIDLRWNAELLRHGICLVDGELPADLVPRIDAVVESPRDVTAVIRQLTASAVDSGSVHAERFHAHEARRFCTRLEQHLLEQRRALARTGDDTRRHHDVIAACVLVVDCVIKSIREQPPVTADAIRAELEAERRKLIMGRKADLLADLDQRIAHSTARKRELGRAARLLADQVGAAAICSWRGELQARVDRRISTHGAEILDRACAACIDHAETILAPAFTGVSAIPLVEVFVVRTEPSPPSRSWTTVLEREWAVRERASTEARDHLVALLERESTRVVEWYVRYYEDACAQLEASFVNGLDNYAQSATIATAHARDARKSGGQALADAHARIDAWLQRLTELQRSIG